METLCWAPGHILLTPPGEAGASVTGDAGSAQGMRESCVTGNPGLPSQAFPHAHGHVPGDLPSVRRTNTHQVTFRYITFPGEEGERRQTERPPFEAVGLASFPVGAPPVRARRVDSLTYDTNDDRRERCFSGYQLPCCFGWWQQFRCPKC